MAKKVKGQVEMWKYPPRKYDFYGDNHDYLICADSDKPDMYLYPKWRNDLLFQLGGMGMLTGKALEEYNIILEGGKQ